MCPLPHSDGCDGVRLREEFSPSVAGGVDDGFVGFEDAVREPVGAQVLPDVFDRVQLRRPGGQEDRGDVLRDLQLGGGVPSSTIHEQHRMRAPGDVAADLLDMELHGLGVGEGQRKRGALAAPRADGPEQIDVLVALVGGLARSGSAPGPLAHEAVLLAYAGFVLPPNFDRLSLRQAGQMGAQRAWKVFLYASMISPSCAGWRGLALT